MRAAGDPETLDLRWRTDPSALLQRSSGRKIFLDGLSNSGPAVRRSSEGRVMTQYLVAIYRPENYDPAVSEDEAMDREIDALNDEMKAAGVRVFVGGLQLKAARGRCGCSPPVRCSSPTGRTRRPRNTLAVFGCWKPLTWTRRWRGGARPPSPVVRRSRCVRFTDGGPAEATERHGRGAKSRAIISGVSFWVQSPINSRWAVSLPQRMILFQNLLQTVAQQLDAVAQRTLSETALSTGS